MSTGQMFDLTLTVTLTLNPNILNIPLTLTHNYHNRRADVGDNSFLGSMCLEADVHGANVRSNPNRNPNPKSQHFKHQLFSLTQP